ncbi:hypothetical protein [Nocardia goodfellowii]|uniref:Small-conductance mechanosensitive channel n=1 Tax=Nocardia goodfellowii TaxID=882446 RepID=A0ABS4QLF0_9NOCA|nr:hypothetical protein [Nocardia goodfellowii]MBP2192525.1 small-conductance mechanosensitive channel [Nocardia goodfellowii]
MSGKTPWWAIVAGVFMFMLLASSLLQAVRDVFTYAVVILLLAAGARLVYVIRHERAVAERKLARERRQRRGPRRQGAMLLNGMDFPTPGEARCREWRTQN